MDVAPATTDDVDALVDRWVRLAETQAAHGSHILAAGNRERIRQAMHQRVVADGLLVAREEDAAEPRGFVMVTVATGGFATDVERGIVENLWVDPRTRGEGVGRALLEAAESHLAERGVDVVALEAMAANDRAREFYREAGYTPHRVEFEKGLESDTHTKGGG